MAHPGIVSALTGQLVSVNAHLSDLGLGPDSTATSAAVARSLRRTLACLLQRRSPQEVGAEGFLLVTDGDGYPRVHFRRELLPTSAGFIRMLFRAAGTELAPGQAVLLDPALGREIAEEALAQNSAEELRLREEKLRLVAACLVGDSDGRAESPCPLKFGRCRSESAV